MKKIFKVLEIRKISQFLPTMPHNIIPIMYVCTEVDVYCKQLFFMLIYSENKKKNQEVINCNV